MNHRSGFTLAAAAAFTLLASASAHADCKAAAIDNCLVGTWKQTGGGAAEWMREHMKMAQVTIQATNATITLNGDGTFSTSKVDAKSEVTVKDAPMQAMGTMSAQSSGQWSAADGMLTLCTTATDTKGSIQFKGPDGKMTSMKMPQMQPTDISMTYTCAGDTLSTVQTMPMNSKMTTTYARVR